MSRPQPPELAHLRERRAVPAQARWGSALPPTSPATPLPTLKGEHVDDDVRQRLVPTPPGKLTSAQREFHRRLTTGPRSAAGNVPMVAEDGSLLGPFAVMAIAPAVGDAVQQLGAAIRYATTMAPATREAAVLAVAAHLGSAFEWDAHELAARRLGFGDDVLDALRAGKTPEGLPEQAVHAVRLVAGMLRTGTLDDAQYAQAVAALGADVLAELVWLTGYYAMLALALNVFAPAGSEATLR